MENDFNAVYVVPFLSDQKKHCKRISSRGELLLGMSTYLKRKVFQVTHKY